MKSAYVSCWFRNKFQSADSTLSGPRGKPHVKLIYAGEHLDADKTVLKPIKLNDNSWNSKMFIPKLLFNRNKQYLN